MEKTHCDFCDEVIEPKKNETGEEIYSIGSVSFVGTITKEDDRPSNRVKTIKADYPHICQDCFNPFLNLLHEKIGNLEKKNEN